MARAMTNLRECGQWRSLTCDLGADLSYVCSEVLDSLISDSTSLNSCLNDEDLDEERDLTADACLKRADTRRPRWK
jgi:hypothetical protein